LAAASQATGGMMDISGWIAIIAGLATVILLLINPFKPK
jgi:hypothetical protein